VRRGGVWRRWSVSLYILYSLWVKKMEMEMEMEMYSPVYLSISIGRYWDVDDDG
jgi:hypothetical protein